MEPALMRLEEVATLLNIKPSKVRAMIFRREIPYLKIGHLVRFRRQEIEIWLNQVQASSVRVAPGAFYGRK